MVARTRPWFLSLAAGTDGAADSHAWPGSIDPGFAGNLLHLLDTDVTEADLQTGFFRGVQLQSRNRALVLCQRSILGCGITGLAG